MTQDATKPDAYATLPAADPAGALRLLYDTALTQARLNLTRAQYELVLSDVALAHATGTVGVAGL